MHGTRSSRLTTYTELGRHQRQRSGSQSNLSELTDRRQTYGGLRRSSSVTNLRTPRGQSSRSPGSRTPLTGLPSSSEQYRRQATENTAKVMEVIQSNRSYFSRTNLGGLSNGGLKSMTSNHSNEIISFFMLKLAGKNFLSKTGPSNFENVIVTFMTSLKYPHSINKACFKTPNAHQSFPEVIAILAFLSDLLRDIKVYGSPDDMPLIHCDQLVNDKFTGSFASELFQNYFSFDPAKDLENEFVTKLVNGLIAIKMKTDGLTVERLAAKVVELRNSSEKLQQNLVQTESDKFFSTIEGQYAEKKKEHEKLQEILAEKRKCLKMIMLTHEERAAQLIAKQAAIVDLTHQIQHQKYTTLDIKQLLAKETSIKSSIAMIKNEKDAIKIEAADAQVKLARLQKLKLDVIKKFNELTFRITQNLMQCTAFEGLNVNDLTIDPTASFQTIQNICSHLNQLSARCSMVKRQYAEEIQQSQHKLAEFEAEFNRLNEQYADCKLKHRNANKQFEILNQKCSNYEGSSSSVKLEREIAEKIAYKEDLSKDIANLKMKAHDLETKNVELLEDGEKQAREIIQAKQTANKQMDELSDFIDQLIDKM